MTTKALTVQEPQSFAILGVTPERFRNVITANLGRDGRLQPYKLTHVSFPGAGATTWSYQTARGEVETKEIQAIILHQQAVRTFYQEAFSGGKNPPDCVSADGIFGDGMYGPNSTGNPAGLCRTCPAGRWDPDTKAPPPCKEAKELYLLTPGSKLPIVMRVPPGSLGALNQYMAMLTADLIGVNGCVTSLTLEKVENKTGIKFARLVLKLLHELTDSEAAHIEAISQEFMAMIGSAPTLAASSSDDAPIARFNAATGLVELLAPDDDDDVVEDEDEEFEEDFEDEEDED